MAATHIELEKMVIEQLRGYRRLISRMKMLEKHPVGYGMYVHVESGEDKLQALHRKLRGMPSYLYLTKKEQDLEQVAHSYLMTYSTGTKNQLRQVREAEGSDEQDRKLLKVLEKKIEKVIEARNGTPEGYQGVIERLSELQGLQREKEQIDRVLELLAEYQPQYERLLRLRYIEGRTVDEVASEFCISRKTFDRWRAKAIAEYISLMGDVSVTQT